jgi:hypothetical protein
MHNMASISTSDNSPFQVDNQLLLNLSREEVFGEEIQDHENFTNSMSNLPKVQFETVVGSILHHGYDDMLSKSQVRDMPAQKHKESNEVQVISQVNNIATTPALNSHQGLTSSVDQSTSLLGKRVSTSDDLLPAKRQQTKLGLQNDSEVLVKLHLNKLSNFDYNIPMYTKSFQEITNAISPHSVLHNIAIQHFFNQMAEAKNVYFLHLMQNYMVQQLFLLSPENRAGFDELTKFADALYDSCNSNQMNLVTLFEKFNQSMFNQMLLWASGQVTPPSNEVKPHNSGF